MKLAACLLSALFFVGCAHHGQPYDYTAFKAAQPKSILVLPPLNNSPEVKATYGMLSQLSYPLAEAGYYVLPVAAVDETFKQNGLANAADIHNVSTRKLHEIFGADAALYVTVTKYGSVYTVLNSEVVVAAEARLVDLRTEAVARSQDLGSVDALSSCTLPGLGQGRRLLAQVDGQLGVVVFRRPVGGTQQAELYVCGTPDPVRTLTLPAP